MDKETVVKYFEFCRVEDKCSTDCPYWDNSYARECTKKLAKDILTILTEQKEQIKNRDESLEKAREEIEWLRGMLTEQKEQDCVCCKKCRSNHQCSIQFKFAYANDEEKWFCANFNPLTHLEAEK